MGQPTAFVTTTTSTSSSTHSPDPPNQPSPLPVGAIAGGAVGGVAFLAGIGVGIWLILRQRKPKPDAGQDVYIQQSHVGGPPGLPTSHMTGGAGTGMGMRPGMGPGMGPSMGAAVVSMNTGEKRESYVFEIDDGVKVQPVAEMDATATMPSAVEIDDGVRMQPVVEMDATTRVPPAVVVDDGVRMQWPVEMDGQGVSATMQPYSQPTARSYNLTHDSKLKQCSLRNNWVSERAGPDWPDATDVDPELHEFHHHDTRITTITTPPIRQPSACLPPPARPQPTQSLPPAVP
ncbi:hypothetical protein G7Z17_g10006 [Cylindrodendrum hubeiense]|uniref:Uncharacterized protein n=1 Tax=Cylindrodendrum hubeiense TaxID=595255 RepID=A0A9P5GYF3_9HYPO|nr:hypothetical protein G7Z17_g10006 [Cylindrodendrum hubeiense]